MPRIAAALAVVAIAVASIGFNIARYPVVWQMVAAAGQGSQAEGPGAPAPSESAAFGSAEPYSSSYSPADPSDETDVVAAISGSDEDDPWPDGDDAWEDSYSSAPDDYSSATDGYDSGSEAGDWSTEPETDDFYGHSARDDWSAHGPAGRGAWQSGAVGPAGADRGLIPVTRPAASAVASTEPPSGSFGTRSAGPDRPAPESAVRRLPTVDVWEPNPNAGQPPLYEQAIPFYPSTGVQ